MPDINVVCTLALMALGRARGYSEEQALFAAEAVMEMAGPTPTTVDLLEMFELAAADLTPDAVFEIRRVRQEDDDEEEGGG